jgi:glycerol-3-phosphate acyltransferase PlsY
VSLIIEILLVILSYLIGSIPFGYLLTYKYTGKNIREYGSGNIGSTNVKRIAGKKIAIQTQLLDMLKGLLPVAITMLLNKYQLLTTEPYFIYIVALASILGHDFSIFLKFRGGKGVNTTLGASILLSPIAVLSGVTSYYIVKWTTKYVSVGSLVLGLVIVLVDFVLVGYGYQFWYFAATYLLIILLHRENLIRVFKGTENKA